MSHSDATVIGIVSRRALLVVLAVVCAGGVFGGEASGQVETGSAERVTVHGASLEGNLSNDAAERDVSVYLPPSYANDTDRRYPVVYMLHGYTDDDGKWFGLVDHWIELPPIVDAALTDPDTREMIIVMPNAYTRFHGSMYSTSVVTGDWERFIAEDLVAYIDAHYRTIPDAAGRGIAGHSMGGYGAMRIGMKRPDVFSSVYLLSPCCLAPRLGGGDSEMAARTEAITTIEEFDAADFGTRATIASAAAWAPNPNNPPFFLDLPTKNGEPQPRVLARFAANAPLAMVDQYIPNLERLAGLAFDAGDEDRGIAASIHELHEILDVYGMPHEFEVYQGDHLSGIAERIRTKVLPFFSRTLAFRADP